MLVLLFFPQGLIPGIMEAFGKGKMFNHSEVLKKGA
jgi:hypothetical protein